MPTIGVPLCLDDRGRWRGGREYLYADVAYANAVARAGGAAVHLPIQEDAERLIAGIDGLLLPGGDDFAPPRPYPDDVGFDPAPDRQIAFDRRLLAAAASRALPVLGICYGMQLMVLEAGGALHYDLASDVPGSDPHRLPEPDGRHAVRLKPDSKLARLLESETIHVNSLHHQAVSDAGTLQVVGRSPDDVIEAVENRAATFQIGVQWHPEKMSEPHAQSLFEALIAAASQTDRG